MSLVLRVKERIKPNKAVSLSSTDIATIHNSNIVELRASLVQKQKEIGEVEDFYDTICRGWEKRKAIALVALVNKKNLQKENREILRALQKKAAQELDINNEQYATCHQLSVKLQEQIKNIDIFVNLQKLAKLTGDTSDVNSFSDSMVRSIHELVYKAEALIELKKV